MQELTDTLVALQRQNGNIPYEVIVVDSASDPEVVKIVASFPNNRLIRSKLRLYPGSARNLGVSHARGEYLAFLDSDTIPEPDWLHSALTALLAGKKFVTGPIRDAYPLKPFAVIDNLLQFSDFSKNRPETPLPYAPGCNLGTSIHYFDELGGFPDIKTAEDVSFTLAANEQWTEALVFVKGMSIFHIGRSTLKTFLAHQKDLGYVRGNSDSRLPQIYRKLGANLVFLPLVVLKRLIYVFQKTLQYNPTRLVLYLFYSPILLLGLFVWAYWFYRGCKDSNDRGGKRS
jgi:glycosyltransferase involved in cell wall biosynthesis